MRCTKCQTELPEGAKFCIECGTNLQGTVSPSQRAAEPASKHLIPQPERRHVTALFSDLAGYTAMSEKLDPEQVKEITKHIFAGARHIITKYEGFIERIMGDGVLAFFGVPRAHEDDPIRAIRAASEIHHLVESMTPHYYQKVQAPLRMHSGINTGLAVTAGVDLEKGAHGVEGDAVNVARRLSDLASPGEILVGHDTHTRARGFFAFEDLGVKKVKGRAESIHVFRLLRSDTSRFIIDFDRHVSSEMLGRDKELTALEAQVMKAVAGNGSVVNVIGEAGMGKSRLIAELKKRDVIKQVGVLEGHAISIGKNLSFHPLTDLLKRWAGIAEGDPEAVAFGKLEQAITAVHPEEAHEILPFLATLMGMKPSGRHADRIKGIEGEALEKLIIKSVRDLVIKGAELRPVVIILEDLHWADVSSLELLKSLYRIASKFRICLINVFRPGYFETDDITISRKGPGLPFSHVDIHLHPLDYNESETLIDNMLLTKGLPVAVKHKIVERAGGNPFFIEEVVRSLIDERAVVRNDGGYEVTANIEKVTISPTINDVLMARIDRLEEQTRELVKIVSVIGRSFFFRVVREVADSIENVDEKLAHLERMQLIRSGMRMGEPEYLFKHALIQEAAYESTLLKQRKELHLRVAKSIERLFKDRLCEFYGTLAYHYSKGENLQKSEECLIKAGEEALRSAASNEALHYYQEALSIYRMLQGDHVDPEKIAMLEKNIALALFNRGYYVEAVEHFDKALSYYWGELPKHSWSTALRFASSLMSFLLALYFPSLWFKRIPTQRDAETVDLYYKKAEALVVINPKRFFTEFFYFYGTIVHYDLTKFKMGLGIFAGSSTLFSFVGLSLHIARKILDYAKPRLDPEDAKQWIIYDLVDTQHLFLKGEWSQIAEYSEQLVTRNLRIGETFWASQHCYWHGLPKIYQGQFDEAKKLVGRLSEMADIFENDIYHLLKYLVNIHLLIEHRHMDEAMSEVNRGVELVQRNGWPQSALTMLALQALVQLSLNELDGAAESLEQANAIRSEVRAAPMQLSFLYRSQFEYHRRRLETSLRTGHKEEASQHSRDALKSAKMLVKVCRKAAQYRTESYRIMGSYKWVMEDRKGALKWWSKAINEGIRLGALPQLARTYAEMGMRLSLEHAQPSDPDFRFAIELLEKARSMFHDLGLHKDLDEVNGALHRMGLETSQS